MFFERAHFKAPALALVLASLAGTASAQTMDNLNGMWKVKLNGQSVPGNALTESYNGIRIRLLPDGEPVDLVRNGDVLTSSGATGNGVVTTLEGENNAPVGPQVSLTLAGIDTWQTSDDKISGTWFGKQIELTRDTRAKAPIEIDMAKGDRPWVRFMREVLIPVSAQDRETYHRFDRTYGGRWLKGTQLGATRYWITKGWIKSDDAFNGMIQGYHGVYNTPRNVLSTKLNRLVSENIREDKTGEIGLALSSLGMYFSTASGGSVRLIVTKNRDSIVYYITDKRSHSRTGLVVNATPTHKPLASSFGKWQNDAGDMTLADDEPYDRAVLELMVKSNTSSMNKVSGTGRGAFTDYFGIMAIEDQRGVMFDNDDLDWGRNMTEASFIISIIRALSHGEYRQKPVYRDGQIVDSSAKELAMQVVVQSWGSSGGVLQPGSPSYIDTLNGADNALAGGHKGGNDCRVSGMNAMSQQLTKWLRAEHPAVIDRLEAALQPFAYPVGTDNVLHAMTVTFYDNANFSKCTPAQGDEIVEAGMEMFRTVRKHSREFEAYMLANGVTKSSEWAPRASGF